MRWYDLKGQGVNKINDGEAAPTIKINANSESPSPRLEEVKQGQLSLQKK